MTRYSFFSIIFLVIFSLASHSVSANGHTAAPVSESNTKKEAESTTSADKSTANKMPVFPAPKPEAPHGKAHAPVMEELPHIHHYHKERVKKIKKHHTKCWVVSQAIVILCHFSMLVIAYLHIIH